MSDRPITAGLVSVTADESGRFTRFAISMQNLIVPHVASKTSWRLGNDIAGNRNAACREMLDLDADWVWFIDDDHVFRPDILLRLLDADCDIVAPVVLRRQKPFASVATDLDGEILDLRRLGPHGAVEVLQTGSSGMLVSRRVLEDVPEPWFELGNGISEDIAFCQKAREHGFRVFVDLGARMGHLTHTAVWPVFNDETGGWVTGLSIADGFQLSVDIAVVDGAEVT